MRAANAGTIAGAARAQAGRVLSGGELRMDSVAVLWRTLVALGRLGAGVITHALDGAAYWA